MEPKARELAKVARRIDRGSIVTLGAQSQYDAAGEFSGGRPLSDRQDTEPWEILYFKAYKSQLPVIEQALETAALMLGSDKSRGYCLEMICADFLGSESGG